jgi:transposase
MRQLVFHGQELKLIDADLARVALGCESTKRLMTIPGVDVTVAMSITAVVGDFSRFSSPNKLVRYLGPEPARQAVRRPARIARPDHQARPRARTRDARRGRLGRGQDAGPAAGVL